MDSAQTGVFQRFDQKIARRRPAPRGIQSAGFWSASTTMGISKRQKTEGGQGGRRGHSNMEHWVTTEEIKDAARGLRRRAAKELIAEEVDAVLKERTVSSIGRHKPRR